MKKSLGITDVDVSFAEYRDEAALSCNYGDERYHIWTDSTLTKHKPTLYKNPRADVQRGDPRYFNTRKLHIDSKLGAQMVEEMPAIVERDGLVEKSRARDRAAKAEVARQQAENSRIARAKEAVPAAIAACKVALAALQGESQLDRANAIKALREAIAKAEA